MAFWMQDRVLMTSTVEGDSNDINITGTVTSFTDILDFAEGAQVNYSIWAVDGAGAPTGDYETGAGSWDATGEAIRRESIWSSSNAGARVEFAAGTKHVTIGPLTTAYYDMDELASARVHPWFSFKSTSTVLLSNLQATELNILGYAGTRTLKLTEDPGTSFDPDYDCVMWIVHNGEGHDCNITLESGVTVAHADTKQLVIPPGGTVQITYVDDATTYTITGDLKDVGGGDAPSFPAIKSITISNPYTVLTADLGKYIRVTVSGVNLNIPFDDGGDPFTVAGEYYFRAVSDAIFVVPDSGVTLNMPDGTAATDSDTIMLAAGGSLTLKYIGSDVWDAAGDVTIVE